MTASELKMLDRAKNCNWKIIKLGGKEATKKGRG